MNLDFRSVEQSVLRGGSWYTERLLLIRSDDYRPGSGSVAGIRSPSTGFRTCLQVRQPQ